MRRLSAVEQADVESSFLGCIAEILQERSPTVRQGNILPERRRCIGPLKT